MGVKACCRADCDGTMSDYYLDKMGYICWECRQELEASKPACIQDVRNFMETSKDEGSKGFDLDKLFR